MPPFSTRSARLAGVLALTVLLAPARPAAADPLEPRETPAGHAYYHLPLPEARYTVLGLTWPNTIAVERPGKEGLGTLGARLPFESAGGRDSDAITEALQDTGEGIVLANDLWATHLNLFAPAGGGFDLAPEIAADILKDADLAEDDLDRLQRETADSLVETARRPDFLLLRAMGAFMAGHDRRLSAVTNRPVATVTDVTIADVQDWHARAFHDAPLVFAAGPAEANAIASAIDAILDGLPAPDAAPGSVEAVAFRRIGESVAVRAPELDQALIMIAHPIEESSVEVALLQTALAGGLDSILVREVRQALSATYRLSTGVVPTVGDQKLLTLSGTVPPGRAIEVRDAIAATFGRLRERGLTEAEFASAREQLAAQIAEAGRDPAAMRGALTGEAMMGRPVDPDRLLDDLEALDLAAMNARLPELLPAVPTTILVAPNADALAIACTVDEPEEAAACD